MDDVAGKELEELRRIETTVRGFLKYFDDETRNSEIRGSAVHPFAKGTVEMVNAVRTALARLDEVRASAPSRASAS